MPYINVYVESSDVLDDIDTDDLVEELESRRSKGGTSPANESADLLRKLWQAFYTGNDARAMELARELAEVGTGRLVPRPPQLRRVS